MPTLKTAIGPVAYSDSAPGTVKPAVILLHSSAGSGAQWKKLARLLAARYRVLVPDLIGYGGTPMTARAPTMADEVAVVSALAETFVGPFHLVGHSYGGAVALEFARSTHKWIASLALFEPVSFHLLSEHGKDAAWAEIEAVATRHIAMVEAGRLRDCAEAFIGYWMGPGAFAAMPAETQAYVVATMPKVAAEWRSVFANRAGAASYGGFAFPVLLLAGQRSTLAARTVAAILRDTVPGIAWQSYPAMGHMGPLTHADIVNAALVEFLDQAAGATKPPLPANDATARPSAAAGGQRRG
jgi:pimeloyl-ACP methyl ester carboxylesterase